MHLIGRDPELAHLDRAWRAAASRPGAVLIEGGAGIGKSALVAAFADKAGVPVLRGESREFGGDALPYAPFLAALADPALLDPARPRAAVFAGLLRRIEAAAPVVVVLEDLHWSDQASRELLAFLVPALHRSRVLLLATYRDDADDALRRVTAGLDRLPNVDRIALGPLSDGAVTELLTGRLGRQPDADLVRRAGGNPLYAEALADAHDPHLAPRTDANPPHTDTPADTPDPHLAPHTDEPDEALRARSGPPRSEAVTVTPDPARPLRTEAPADARSPGEALREVLLAPLRALPPESRAVVRVAAVLGRDVDDAVLRRIAGPADEHLRPAVERRLLTVRDGGYRFRHDLIRGAVHDELTDGERARLHRLAAGAITATLGFRPAAAALVELADHWHAAGDVDRAFDAAWRAAAAARSAHGGRLRLLERVAGTWDRVFDPEFRTRTDRLSVLTAAAVAALHAGAVDRGLGLIAEALELTRDPARLALLLETRGLLLHRGGDDGIEDLRAALALQPRNNRVRAALASRLEALSRSPEAFALAEEAAGDRDPAVRALALVTLAAEASDPGPGADPQTSGSRIAVGRAREAVELAREGGDDDTELLARVVEANALEAAGESRAAAEAAEAGLLAARRAGVLLPERDAMLAAALAGSLTALGEWPRARAVAGDALALEPPPLYRAVLTIAVGRLDALQGDRERAEAAARAGEELLGVRYTGRQFLMPLWELRTLLGAPAALDDRQLPSHPALAWSLLLAQPEPDRRFALRLPVNGPVQRAASLTVARRWDEAIAAWRATGHPYRLAQTLLRAGRAARDRSTAVARAREAAALAARLGARPLAEEAAALQKTGRLEPGVARLTERELEVLRLMAEGHTNKQIAAALTIAVKTAGVHVTNILSKLGVNSRVDAVTVARRRGLLGARPPA